MTESQIVVFESARFSAVLTFTWGDGSGKVTVKYSIRSHKPQPVAAHRFALTVWESWVAAIDLSGVLPPLPKGWHLKDGGKDADTSVSPDHHH